MSDYESFIKTAGRGDLIKQVRSRIDELGIEYLYLQFVSVTGRIMGKGIPADHWERHRQTAAFSSSTAPPSICS